jgi:hypothetical protein
MPARRQTTRSGTKVLADVAATRGGAAQALKHRTWTPDNDTTEERARDEQPHRRSSSFTAPLRESFFDLAQRYHRLRESAFTKSRQTPKSLPPPIPLVRERRLTDLPPAPSDESATESVFADRYVDESPEEETLVQPLARRPSDAPPASERRQFGTMRPPPPPDPLPRILPSTAPLVLATVPPAPPPAPHPGLWRPMLVTAAMSAAIGAIVSVGMWAVRTPAAAERATAERPTAALTASPVAANTIGPCPIPTSSLSNSSSSSSGSSNSNSHSSSSGLHEVALEALPIETTSPRSAAVSTPVLRAPATAPAHMAHLDLTDHASKRASEPPRAAPAAAPIESEKPSKRSRKGAKAEKTEAAQPADEEAALAAAGSPEPAPAPTSGPDRAAIAKAVGRAAAAASSCESGPQSGRAQITFAPSGNVASVQLLEPFSDNGVNGCVLRALGRAHVPPFAGEPVIVRKGLSW